MRGSRGPSLASALATLAVTALALSTAASAGLGPVTPAQALGHDHDQLAAGLALDFVSSLMPVGD